MSRMVRNPLTWVSRLLANRWSKSESDFTLVKALEPVVSNKGLFAWVLPIPLLSAALKLGTDEHGDALLVLLAAWGLIGVVLMAAIAFRWFGRALGFRQLAEDVEASRQRLGRALAVERRKNVHYFAIDRWEEFATTAKDGHTRLERRVSIRVGPDPLELFWSTLDCDMPTGDSGLVNIVASELIDRGREKKPLVRKLDADLMWRRDASGKLSSDILAYFASPVTPGSVVTLSIVWDWPGFFDHVLSLDQDEWITYRLSRPCAEFELQYRFPSVKDRRIVLRDLENLSHSVDRTHKFETIVLKAENLAAGESVRARISPSRTK